MNKVDVIQAQSGWAVVIPCYDDEDDGLVPGIDHEPIIAWALNSEGERVLPEVDSEETVPLIFPWPVTATGLHDVQVMQYPNGKYRAVTGETLNTVADVIEFFRKQESHATSKPDLQKGDEVYWHDPAGETSGYGVVIDADHPEVVVLKMHSGSEVEAFIHEIVKVKPYLLVVWNDIEPEIIGPFSSEESRLEAARDVRSKDSEKRHGIYCLEGEGHVEVDSFAGETLDEE